MIISIAFLQAGFEEGKFYSVIPHILTEFAMRWAQKPCEVLKPLAQGLHTDTKATRQWILTRVNRASKSSCKSALLSVFSTYSSFSPERHSPYSTTFIYTNPSWFGLEVSWMSVHHFEDKTLSQDTTSPGAQLPCTAHHLASSLSSPFPFPVWKCILLSHVSGLCTFPLPRIFLFLLKGWGGSFPQFTTVEMSWLFPRPFWNDVLLCSSYLKLAYKLHFYVL